MSDLQSRYIVGPVASHPVVFGTLPGVNEFSRRNPSGGADFHVDAKARSIGARPPSGGGGVPANNNPARGQIRIKVMGKNW